MNFRVNPPLPPVPAKVCKWQKLINWFFMLLLSESNSALVVMGVLCNIALINAITIYKILKIAFYYAILMFYSRIFKTQKNRLNGRLNS